MRPQDSSDLHGKPMMVKVAVENRKDTGEPANRIKGYKAVEGASVPSAPAAKLSQVDGGPKAAPPWGKAKAVAK
jgi:hypothetical protein